MKITDKYLIVTVPVADLRRKPVDAKSSYIHDDLQESQVLYNETLLYRDEIEDWYYAEATEQRRLIDGHAWQGYPGWIRKGYVMPADTPWECNAVVRSKTASILEEPSDKAEVLMSVSIGTRLLVGGTVDKKYHLVKLADNKEGCIRADEVNRRDGLLDEGVLRKTVIGTARLFLDVHYLWGGRSMYMPELAIQGSKGQRQEVRSMHSFSAQRAHHHAGAAPRTVLTGVDCSGLTNLSYRVSDIDIPRDAQDQWIVAERITHRQLKAGDLIFVSAEDKPDTITHVMLSMGGEKFIEAAETGGFVRVSTFIDKFGKGLSQLAGQDFFVNHRQIYFSSIISHDE